MATNGGSHIQAGPFTVPVEFARWLIGQAALFLVVVMILYLAQTTLNAALSTQEGLIAGQQAMASNDRQIIANEELLLRYCNVAPAKVGPP